MKEQYCVLGDHMWMPDAGRGLAAKACPDHYDRNALRRWRRAQDPERFRAYDRERYRQDPDNPKYQAWRLAHPDEYRTSHRRIESNRRAAKRELFIEDVDPLVVYEMHGGMCGICKEFIEGDFHVDHVIPLVKGGMHGYINVQPAHPLCNIRKSDKVGWTP